MSSRGRTVAVSGAAKYTRAASPGVGGTVSWDAADAEMLLSCVCSITDAGDAILLAKSRDGGTLTVWVMAGGETAKFYAHSPDELVELLDSLTSANVEAPSS